MLKWFFKGIYSIVKKELADSFKSSFIYIITALFTFLVGVLFFIYVVNSKELTTLNITGSILQPVFSFISVFFLFVSPLLTMSSLTDERKNHTLELLFLSKLSDTQVIIGKYIASICTVLFLLLFTLIFPVIIAATGYSDWGVVISTFIGLILSTMCYLSIGLFVSSMTDNQIVAAFSGFAIVLLLSLLNLSMQATNNWMIGQIFQYISVYYHFLPFTRGEIRLHDIFYFFTFISFFLWLTKQSLESKRW